MNQPSPSVGTCLDVQSFINAQPLSRYQWRVVILCFLIVFLDGLDTAVFDAFNRCADPARLAEHAAYFDPAVEFYHDNGGATWTRDEMIERTRANVCGNYRRERVPGTLKVFPIKDFGAIAQGTHRFCPMGSTACAGEADFVMVWRERDGQWQVTRVLSYAHRPAP